MTLISVWVTLGVIGMILGAIRHRAGAGFILGALLGPVGWVLVLAWPRARRPAAPPPAATRAAVSRFITRGAVPDSE